MQLVKNKSQTSNNIEYYFAKQTSPNIRRYPYSRGGAASACYISPHLLYGATILCDSIARLDYTGIDIGLGVMFYSFSSFPPTKLSDTVVLSCSSTFDDDLLAHKSEFPLGLIIGNTSSKSQVLPIIFTKVAKRRSDEFIRTTSPTYEFTFGPGKSAADISYVLGLGDLSASPQESTDEIINYLSAQLETAISSVTGTISIPYKSYITKYLQYYLCGYLS